MKYNDFVITIEKGGENKFFVRAEQRLVGDNDVDIRPVNEHPQVFDAQKFLEELPELKQAITSAIYGRSHDRNLIKQFACDLFNELFKDAIRPAFRHAFKDARREKSGLRIRLQLPPELQELPWELICEMEKNTPPDFLCLSGAKTFVRSDARAGQIKPDPINPPLRLLVVACTPIDHAPLKTREEIDLLLSSLAGLIRTGKVQADFVHGANTLNKIQHLMQGQEKYHILHFIGHGEKGVNASHLFLADDNQNVLVLEDNDRKLLKITAMKLWQRLQAFIPPRLVFLNVCKGAAATTASPFTSIAESFLRAGTPAVIGHQFEITDQTAVVFARSLYEGLADGVPMDEALANARRDVDLKLHSTIEWHIPVLFLYNATGELFTFKVTEAPSPNVALLIQKANEAKNVQRWSEAADYAQEVLTIRPDYAEMQSLRDRALKEEALDLCLHEARFAENFEDWAGALSWYGKFLDDKLAESRPQSQRDLVARLKQSAQAGLGIHDPSLKWKG